MTTLPRPSARADRGLRSALLLGASAGLRSFTPPAVLVAHGRLTRSGVGRVAALGLAAAELAADKHPATPSRTAPQGFVGRLGTGAGSGLAVAGRAGAVAGGVAAAATTIAGPRARAWAAQRTGLRDPAIALVEDALAIGLATIGTRIAPSPEQSEGEPGRPGSDAPAASPALAVPGVADAALRGIVASAVGTAGMTAAQLAAGRWGGVSSSDAPARAGERVLRTTLGRRIRRRDRPAFNQQMHWLYGTSWGVPLGLAAAGRDTPAAALLTGAGFGIAVWAASLGLQPALGAAPPVWRQSGREIAIDGGFHLVYGVTAGAALGALRRDR